MIVLFTRRSRRSPAERRLVGRGHRYHATRAAFVAAAVVLWLPSGRRSARRRPGSRGRARAGECRRPQRPQGHPESRVLSALGRSIAQGDDSRGRERARDKPARGWHSCRSTRPQAAGLFGPLIDGDPDLFLVIRQALYDHGDRSALADLCRECGAKTNKNLSTAASARAWPWPACWANSRASNDDGSARGRGVPGEPPRERPAGPPRSLQRLAGRHASRPRPSDPITRTGVSQRQRAGGHPLSISVAPGELRRGCPRDADQAPGRGQRTSVQCDLRCPFALSGDRCPCARRSDHDGSSRRRRPAKKSPSSQDGRPMPRSRSCVSDRPIRSGPCFPPAKIPGSEAC